MGKPAARVLIDTAGHSGPITTGSFNVLIGGMPASRQGDGFICTSHGVGSIIEGESTVLINGKPAARMGDKTSCDTPPDNPIQGPDPAKDEISFHSLDKNADENGLSPTLYPDNLEVRSPQVYHGVKKNNEDGTYDKYVAGGVLSEIRAKGEWVDFGEENGGIGASGGLSTVKLDLEGNTYTGNGVYGYEGKSKGSVVGGDAEVHIGKEDVFFGEGKAEGELLFFEANSVSKVYNTDKRTGLEWEKTAEAGVAQGDLSFSLDTPFISFNEANHEYSKNGTTKSKGGNKIGGTVGGAGGTIGIGGYWDKDDYKLNIHGKIGGEFGFGLDAAFDVSFKFKPFVNAGKYIWNKAKDGVSGLLGVSFGTKKGTILSGCPTVLIGTDTLKNPEYTGSGWGHDFRQWIAKKLGIDNDITNVVGAGVLSMLQCDEANLTGQALEKVKKDPAMLARENKLVEMAKNDPRYGKEDFIIEGSIANVGFGGDRAPGEMWDQFKDPLNPDYRATWEVAGNELTWLVRNTNVTSTVNVAADGSMTIDHSFSDVFDLRPSGGRSDAYNTATDMLGTAYHDILGGNDELKINAKWTSKR